jgi:hypothetical protein
MTLFDDELLEMPDNENQSHLGRLSVSEKNPTRQVANGLSILVGGADRALTPAETSCVLS